MDFPFDEEDTRTIVSDVEAVVSEESARDQIMHSTARELFEV